MNNMKRQLFILTLAICSICASYAQEFKIGMHIGANMSNFSKGDTYRINDNKYKVGAEIGADIFYTTKNKYRTIDRWRQVLRNERLLFRRRTIHGI